MRTIRLNWKACGSYTMARTESGRTSCVYAVWACSAGQLLYVGKTKSLDSRYHTPLVDALLAACSLLARQLSVYRDGTRQLLAAFPDTILGADQRRRMLAELAPSNEAAHFFVAPFEQDETSNIEEIEFELLNRTLPIFNQRGITTDAYGRIGLPNPDIHFVHEGDSAFAAFLNALESPPHALATSPFKAGQI
jgi:hypothetical protein